MLTYKTQMSEVSVDVKNGIVTKGFLSKNGTRIPMHKVFKREVLWLTRLREFNRVPSIISTKSNTILMTYVGERITKETVPSDWKEQVDYIVTQLKEYQCCHNDIKPEEILVMNGKINLVDFNWATKTGEPIPKNWPGCLGDERFGKGILDFDDKFSFYRSIEYVIND